MFKPDTAPSRAAQSRSFLKRHASFRAKARHPARDCYKYQVFPPRILHGTCHLGIMTIAQGAKMKPLTLIQILVLTLLAVVGAQASSGGSEAAFRTPQASQETDL